MMTSQKKIWRGFSLIEVMVAMVLLALMGLLLMQSLNSSVRAKDEAENISGRFQEARQAMARMSRDISMAYLSKNMYSLEPNYITQFKGRKNSLFFSAFGHVVRQKDAKESDQQVLGFYLAEDKKGQQSLMRREHPNLNLDVEQGGKSQVLCSNVSKLEFSYYDDRLNKWEETWIADPSASQGQAPATNKAALGKEGEEQKETPKIWRLPAAVKITMSVVMEEGHEMNWVSEVGIPVQEPLDLN